MFFVVALAFASCKSKGQDAVFADVDPIEVGSIVVQLDNYLGTSIEPKPLTVFFAPRTDCAILEYKYTGNTYKLHLTREARELVRKAAVQYNADFDAVQLDRDLSYRKSERIYGEVKDCYMEWGLMSITMTGKANPKITAGYRFEDRNPYFVVTAPVTENLGYKENVSGLRNSVKQVIYMNKAQALALADALDENKLMATLSTLNLPDLSAGDADSGYGKPKPEYDEYGATPAADETSAETAGASDVAGVSGGADAAGENAGNAQ